MKQPSLMTYLFGNPLVFFGVGTVTAITAWQAINGNASGLLLLPLAVLGLTCKRSYGRLDAYRAWKREWDAMNGAPPRAPLSWRWLRYPIGIAVWGVAAAASPSLAGDPATSWMALLFWLGSGGLIVRALYQWGKRHTPVASASPVVAVCPAVPLRSTAVAQTYSVLPDYCGRVLQR